MLYKKGNNTPLLHNLRTCRFWCLNRSTSTSSLSIGILLQFHKMLECWQPKQLKCIGTLHLSIDTRYPVSVLNLSSTKPKRYPVETYVEYWYRGNQYWYQLGIWPKLQLDFRNSDFAPFSHQTSSILSQILPKPLS